MEHLLFRIPKIYENSKNFLNFLMKMYAFSIFWNVFSSGKSYCTAIRAS